MRIEPAPSEPCANGPIPEETAAAAPPLDPPAVRPSRHGFCVLPCTRLVVSPFHPYSEVLLFPSITAPARYRRSTSGASSAGTSSAWSSDPRVVRMPAVAVRSLIETGTPATGPAEPSA